MMCPLCGQRGAAVEESGSEVGFVPVGEERGRPAYRCYVCGSGFVIHGANTEPIPGDRWALIAARYAAESQRSV
jgi:hypothetical protein